MDMMIKPTTYSVLPELNLVIECFGGRFTASDLLKLKKLELKDPLYKSSFNFIGDLTLSSVDTTYEDLVDYIKIIKSMEGVVSYRKSAIITATPNHVVYSTLLKTLGKQLPMKFEIVSTQLAAFNYLGIAPCDYSKVEAVLKGLKLKFLL